MRIFIKFVTKTMNLLKYLSEFEEMALLKLVAKFFYS